jgi:eukaryotic-like serine/threonine-protein kinase
MLARDQTVDTSEPEISEGRVIAGQYRLTREIGAGGVGAVWEAENLRVGGKVAMKFLGDAHRGDAQVEQRFASEARAASRIRSPHVVQVFDHGKTEHGIPYLVMELLEGEDLASYLAREGARSLLETALIVMQIGRALSRAHAHGLVHRDVKPHNIFLSPESDGEWFVKLLDFGIAKDVWLETKLFRQRGAVLGSAHYMSPEQLEDPERVGPEADIWALGVVVYQMLTGHVPFDGASIDQVLVGVQSAQFVPALHHRPDLPSQIESWLRKAMHPKAAQRFASVDEMTREFVQIVRDEGERASLGPSQPPLPMSALPTQVNAPSPLNAGSWRPHMTLRMWAITVTAGIALAFAIATGFTRKPVTRPPVFVPTPPIPTPDIASLAPLRAENLSASATEVVPVVALENAPVPARVPAQGAAFAPHVAKPAPPIAKPAAIATPTPEVPKPAAPTRLPAPPVAKASPVAAAPQANAAPRAKPEPQAEAAPHAKPEPQAEAAPHAKPEPQAEAAPHAKPEPQAEAAASHDRSTAPQSKSAAPQAKAAAPQSNGAAPQAKAAAPQSKSAAPQAKASGPQANSAATLVANPASQVAKPAAQGSKPAAQAAKPAAQAAKPAAQAAKPEAQAAKPEPRAAKSASPAAARSMPEDVSPAPRRAKDADLELDRTYRGF